MYADSWERNDDTDEKTCSHNVEMVRRCNICHQVADVQTISSAVSDWIITKQPTTREEGERIKKCLRCGKIIVQEVVPKLTNGDIVYYFGLTYRITGLDTVEYVNNDNRNRKDIVIPNTITLNDIVYRVTSIADNAFKNNKKIRKVTIGENIERIGSKAFYGCKNLKTIILNTLKLKKKTVGSKAFSKIGGKRYKRVRVKVPKNKKKTYQKILISKGLNPKIKVR